MDRETFKCLLYFIDDYGYFRDDYNGDKDLEDLIDEFERLDGGV